MGKRLHITNGDSVSGTLEAVFPEDEIVPWRDILHEGPVPGGLSLRELSKVRAAFIASSAGGAESAISLEFARRDDYLAHACDYDELVLWFEHDLYDQLQLIQIISSLDKMTALLQTTLICIGEFEGIPDFKGLGQLYGDQLLSLFPSREPLRERTINQALNAWKDFTASEPTGLIENPHNEGQLNFLESALIRHCEQFPSAGNGLSRTENQILRAVSEGFQTPIEIFQRNAALDGVVFMGDSVVWSYVTELCSGAVPLIECLGDGYKTLREVGLKSYLKQRFRLTAAGEEVLAGEADSISLRGLDKHLGGVHLVSPENVWRWDGVRFERR